MSEKPRLLILITLAEAGGAQTSVSLLLPGLTGEFDVGTTNLIFNNGHRLRVAISSSDYPRFEANRNNGKSWPNDQNFPSVVAHQTVFHDAAHPSRVILPVQPL